LDQRQWEVGGVTRTVLIHIPTGGTTEKSPLVFVFHGRSGTSGSTARKMAIHEHWPEAIVVYPQGLSSAIRYAAAGVKPGWQQGIGDNNDRDLKFFYEMLSALREEFTIDDARIYVTGHSIGGASTYLLWAAASLRQSVAWASSAQVPKRVPYTALKAATPG
jgi:polyhydroxybutyrate depolymerase